MSRRDLSQWAVGLGVSEEEMAGIASQVRVHYHLHIIRFDRLKDGAIAVMLADKPDRPHGIVVVFRKVGDHWEEDPESQGEWIV